VPGVWLNDTDPKAVHLWSAPLQTKKHEGKEIKMPVKKPTGKEIAILLSAKASVVDAFAAPFATLYAESELFANRVTSFNGNFVDGVKDDQTLAADQLRDHVKSTGREDLARTPFPIIKRVVGSLRRRAKISPRQLTDQSASQA
jgi:hypothetical protein